MACSSGRKFEVSQVPEQFPVGLRVLVVDDDDICLRVLEKMLRKCMYQVTICSQAEVALNLLRERKGCFDLVLSDVHMPDMDGFKLLELVGLEMDLPVIMMSADGRTSLVLRGIQHGACDYLIKPIRDEELKNIWQHVVRKRWIKTKSHYQSGNLKDHDRLKRATDDSPCGSSANEGPDEALKERKKKRSSKDGDETEPENDDPNGTKKTRVVWSVELHQQFVTAVNQLGIEKAVPKRILELMNVPGLTRENVASHLQKFRLYLKRLSGISQRGVLSSFCGSVEENLKVSSLERLDIHALAASGQLPAQTLAALQSELMSRSASNLMLLSNNPRTPSHSSLPGSRCLPADSNVAYGQPLMKVSSIISRQPCQPLVCNENACPEVTGCLPNNLCDVPGGSHVTFNENNNVLASLMQQPQPKLKQPITIEATSSMNIQPSCLVVPPRSLPYIQEGVGPDSFNQNFRVVDHSNPSRQLSKSSFAEPAMRGECEPLCSSPVFLTPRNVQVGSVSQLASSPWGINPKTAIEYSSSNRELNMVSGCSMDPLNPCIKASIPSRFAVDEHELASSSICQVKVCGEINPFRVKQEANMDLSHLTDNVRVGIPVRLKLPSNAFSD